MSLGHFPVFFMRGIDRKVIIACMHGSEPCITLHSVKIWSICVPFIIHKKGKSSPLLLLFFRHLLLGHLSLLLVQFDFVLRSLLFLSSPLFLLVLPLLELRLIRLFLLLLLLRNQLFANVLPEADPKVDLELLAGPIAHGIIAFRLEACITTVFDRFVLGGSESAEQF